MALQKEKSPLYKTYQERSLTVSVCLSSPAGGQIDGCVLWIPLLDVTKLIKRMLNLARWRWVNMIWNAEYLLVLFPGLEQEARPCP